MLVALTINLLEHMTWGLRLRGGEECDCRLRLLVGLRAALRSLLLNGQDSAPPDITTCIYLRGHVFPDEPDVEASH